MLERVGIICASILGYLVGRSLYGDHDHMKQAREFNVSEEFSSWKNWIFGFFINNNDNDNNDNNDNKNNNNNDNSDNEEDS